MRIKKLLLTKEYVLVEKILEYGKKNGYMEFAPTLVETLHKAIKKISGHFILMLEANESIPNFAPDEDYLKNKVSMFGIEEGKKHRERGIKLSMFLGFIRYYQQAYTEVIKEEEMITEEKDYLTKILERFFDYLEIGVCIEWTGLSDNDVVRDLQAANLKINNEKNKYLAVFESMCDPALLFSSKNKQIIGNKKFLDFFCDEANQGENIYDKCVDDENLSWLKKELKSFSRKKINMQEIERKVNTIDGEKTFLIKYNKIRDISNKYEGAIIVFNDITERVLVNNKLLAQKEKLQSYAFTDQMTGLLNRRAGYIILEKELSMIKRREEPLSICYLDIDNLKIINDKFGHKEGDEIINFFASVIKKTIREIDEVIRMGGDEFLIVLPLCNKKDALLIVNRIVLKFVDFDNQNLKKYKHTFSYGIVEINKDSVLNIDEAINSADKKMYNNKKQKKYKNKGK